MVKTHLILDGLQDMGFGGELSRRWYEAGFENVVDVGGQCAWVSRRADWDWGAVEAGYLHVGGDMTSGIAAEIEQAERDGSAYGYGYGKRDGKTGKILGGSDEGVVEVDGGSEIGVEVAEKVEKSEKTGRSVAGDEDGRQDGLAGGGDEKVLAEVEVVAVEDGGKLKAKGSDGETSGEVTEEDVDLCGRIARAYGIEIRDRAGTQFSAVNYQEQMWRRAKTEYKYRVANVLVYGLPVVGLHYVGDLLWMKMFYPWLTGLLLVGWAMFGGGWPLVWNGLSSMVHLRLTGDLLTGVLLLWAFLGSVYGVVEMLWVDDGWFGKVVAGGAGGEPMLLGVFCLLLSGCLGRYLVYKHIKRLSGKGHLIVQGFGKWVGAWLIVSLLAGYFGGWAYGIGFGLILPSVGGLGGINGNSPGVASLLPVLGFGLFYLFGGVWVGEIVGAEAGDDILRGYRVEVGAVFGFLMLFFYDKMWGRLKVNEDG